MKAIDKRFAELTWMDDHKVPNFYAIGGSFRALIFKDKPPYFRQHYTDCLSKKHFSLLINSSPVHMRDAVTDVTIEPAAKIVTSLTNTDVHLKDCPSQ